MNEATEKRKVTPQTYCRAESDRTFYNTSQMAGGVEPDVQLRNVVPLDRQTVVRMNKDTLYRWPWWTRPGAPPSPCLKCRRAAILRAAAGQRSLLPGVIYTRARMNCADTKYLGIAMRIAAAPG